MLCRKQLLLLIVSSFFWTSVLYAQNKQANNWYFGQRAGITFNTPDGSPQAVFDGQINQWEGCASISGKDGNLLFYTDGVTVWNSMHDTMPNGNNLGGDPSATMSSIVIPAPGNDSLYYLFTIPEINGYEGLRYSIVNMNLDNGLGDISERKNIFLSGPVHEKVTSVAHANGLYVWVITHLWGGNTFLTYLIDTDSLHTEPIVQSIGEIHNYLPSITGYMKASPDGKHLALIGGNPKMTQIFNFDNLSGVLSNPISLVRPIAYHNPYGLGFSPNGTKLYVSSLGYEPSGIHRKIHQYNLESEDSLTIVNSEIEIVSLYGVANEFGAMQIGPNHRLYIAKNSHAYLSIIENPDSLGALCNFVDSALFLDDGTNTHLSRLGLPAFIQSFFNYASFTWEGHCIGDTSFFAITDTASQDSVFWDFGDLASGAANYSDSFFPYHVYEDTGAYQVSVIGYNNSLNDTTVQEVFIHPFPVPFLPADTGFCEGYGVNLWPGDFQSYLWQNGSTDTSFYADTTLSVIVEVTDVQGCKNLDTTQAVEHSKPDPFLIFHD